MYDKNKAKHPSTYLQIFYKNWYSFLIIFIVLLILFITSCILLLLICFIIIYTVYCIKSTTQTGSNSIDRKSIIKQFNLFKNNLNDIIFKAQLNNKAGGQIAESSLILLINSLFTKERFKFQYTLSNGKIIDLVIFFNIYVKGRLTKKKLFVDSKCPMIKDKTVSIVKGKIGTYAASMKFKYLNIDQSLPFMLMFVPNGKVVDDLIKYDYTYIIELFYGFNVIITHTNTIIPYLLMISILLKDDILPHSISRENFYYLASGMSVKIASSMKHLRQGLNHILEVNALVTEHTSSITDGTDNFQAHKKDKDDVKVSTSKESTPSNNKNLHECK